MVIKGVLDSECIMVELVGSDIQCCIPAVHVIVSLPFKDVLAAVDDMCDINPEVAQVVAHSAVDMAKQVCSCLVGGCAHGSSMDVQCCCHSIWLGGQSQQCCMHVGVMPVAANKYDFAETSWIFLFATGGLSARAFG